MAYKTITPAYDNKIYQKYSKKMIQNKEKNKIAFCQDFGLPFDKKIPLVCITYPLTEKNNVEMMKDVMNGILEQAVEIVITGIGTKQYQDYFEDLAEKFPHKVTIIPDNEENRRKLYAAADMTLITCDAKECIEEVKKTMNYGVVPIVPEIDGVTDYNPVQEKGNGFVYKKTSPWSLFATFIRAYENFRFPYDWKNIQVSAMRANEEDDE